MKDYHKAEMIKAQALSRLANMEFDERERKSDNSTDKWNVQADPKGERKRDFLYKFIAGCDSISWFLENRETLQFSQGLGFSITDLNLSKAYDRARTVNINQIIKRITHHE